MGFFDQTVQEASGSFLFRLLIFVVITVEIFLARVLIAFANHWATKQRLLLEIEKKKKDGKAKMSGDNPQGKAVQ